MNKIIEKFMAKVNENKDVLAVFDNEKNLSRKELLLLANSIAARLPKGCKRVGIYAAPTRNAANMDAIISTE